VAARVKLADVYRQLGLFSDAIQQLEQAVLLHQKAGQLTEALAALKQVLELNPDQPATRIRLCRVGGASGRESTTPWPSSARRPSAQGPRAK